MSKDAAAELKGTGYEVFIACVAALSIINIGLQFIAGLQSVSLVLYAMNLLLSLILLFDFGYRLATAPSRSGYFFRRFGWADLIASIPVPGVKLLRVFRLLRVLRLLRRIGVRQVLRALAGNRAGSALLSLLFVALLVMEFGSLAMLRLEDTDPDATITTAADALWYVLATMSTVGYGDVVPVTTGGRTLGALVIIVGVGIFGTLTGYLANAFLGSSEEAAEPVAAAGGEPGTDLLVQLRQLRAEQQQALDRIDRLIERADG